MIFYKNHYKYENYREQVLMYIIFDHLCKKHHDQIVECTFNHVLKNYDSKDYIENIKNDDFTIKEINIEKYNKYRQAFPSSRYPRPATSHQQNTKPNDSNPAASHSSNKCRETKNATENRSRIRAKSTIEQFLEKERGRPF